MSLPKIEHPIFRTTLPSTGKEIRYRPFTVKEEKILLIAEMSEDVDDMILALKQILTNCIVDDVKIDDLATFDLEYMFIQIRARSIGNLIKFTVQDGEDEKLYEIEIDIDDVKVDVPEGKNIIKLDENTVMELNWPRVNRLDEMMKMNRSNPDDLSRIIVHNIARIYDDEKVYDLTEETEQEIIEWLDSFGLSVMRQIDEFWDTVPTVYAKIEYKNSLNHDRYIEFKGLKDFFV